MSSLVRHAAWILLITFSISLAYELYRATAKARVSKHDSMSKFLRGLLTYLIAGIVIAALFADLGWAPWAGLVLSVVGILVSIFYYNPTIMMDRQPQLIDWIEDLVFTGLLFVSATLLVYEVLGKSLQG